MNYINRLPVLFATFFTMIFGMICYSKDKTSKEIFICMTFVLILFYFIGVIIKNVFTGINNDLDEKHEIEEQERLEEEKQNKKDEMIQEQKQKSKDNSYLNYKIDEDISELVNPINKENDELDPLPVSEFIQKEFDENQ